MLRRYIELRFGIHAGEQTSEEFLAAVQRGTAFEPRHREVLSRFVRACDPVKYAAVQPTDDAAAWLDGTARAFIAETTMLDSPGDATVEKGVAA